MTKLVLCFVFGLGLAACSTNPYKAEKVNTELDKTTVVTSDTNLGVKDGNLVVQKKTPLADELRDLQIEVYSTEDHVYGNPKYGSLGLYGVLRNCRLQLSDKKYGGDGKLIWTEPIDRVTEQEQDFRMGFDEKSNLVAVNEEYLKDRLNRFRDYKKTLRKREFEYEEKVDICQADLRARAFDAEKQASEHHTE